MGTGIYHAARRAAQNQRQAARRARVDHDIVGGPSPAGPDFDHVGLTMVGPRRIQQERQGTLAPELVRKGIGDETG